MSPERGLRERLSTALGALVDLVDPSILAPGAACLLGLLFPWLYEGRIATPKEPARLAAYAGVAWVMGLVCVVLGRQVRQLVSRRLRPRGALHDRVSRAAAAHGLPTRLSGTPPAEAGDPLARYDSAHRLLERIEASLRGTPALWLAHRDLERLTARGAACDGLAVALLVGAAVLAYAPTQLDRWPAGPSASLVLAGVVVAVALALWAEAHRLEKERVDALVALAAAQRPRVGEPSPAAAPAE